MYMPRQLISLRKSDCLGSAVLLCLVVCLTLLASFFLPSLKHVHVHVCYYYYLQLCGSYIPFFNTVGSTGNTCTVHVVTVVTVVVMLVSCY